MNEMQPMERKTAEYVGIEPTENTTQPEIVSIEVEGAVSEAIISTEGEGAVEAEGAAREASSSLSMSGEGAVEVEGAVEEATSSSSSPSDGDTERKTNELPSSGEETIEAAQFKCCVVCKRKCIRKRKRCKQCRSGCYCSKSCRERHKDEHASLCGHIQTLESIESAKKVLPAFSVRELNQVKVKVRQGLVKLVGEKPLLKCTIGGSKSEALWDTGAMVCMISTTWLEENEPDARIMSIEEFLEGDTLHLCAANNTGVDVAGVVELTIGIGENFQVTAPFLVTNDKISTPIVGYNLIKYVVTQEIQELPGLLKASLPCVTTTWKAEAVISLIQEDMADEEEVKVAKRIVIPPNARSRVKCRTGFRSAEEKQNVIFSPYPMDRELEMSDSVLQIKPGQSRVHVVVTNPTNHPMSLEKGLVLGSVESLSAVIPIPTKDKPGDGQEEVVKGNCEVEGPTESQPVEEMIPQVDLSHLSEDQRIIAEKMLLEERGVFCLGKEDHGDCPDLQMELALTDNVPVVVPHRHIPRPLYDEVKNFINDLISNKWVRESKSAYSSPIVCVRKKDSSLRLCIDYRGLNKKIIPDKQPIPRIQEVFDGLDGQEWFTTLDMAKAYHQGYVAEEFRKYTAFSTPWGHYEWIRVPMGISNAPPAFQRFINQTLAGLRDKVCIAYLDDILVYGRTFEEQVDNLRLVLRRLQSKGIKLRADKCFFFQKEVRYLGRLISKNGHRPDPKDTVALEKFRTAPQTIGELRTLLGFMGYYRSYVKDFSRKFQPLYQLLKAKGTPETDRKFGKKKHQKNSKTPIPWTVAMQGVVDETIDYLKSPEFLVFPDYSQPFILNCDASEKGLGAVLYQKRDGKNRVISYGSRTLTDAERNYHLHSGKLEFLGLKWAITDKFSDYLGYSNFEVYTDNNPLTYVMSSAKLNATGLRWVAELAHYQFQIKYKPGRKNGDADGLSRCPLSLEEFENLCTERMDPVDLSTVMPAIRDSQPSVRPVDISVLELVGDCDIKEITTEDLKYQQSTDQVVGPVYHCVAAKKKPSKEDLKSWNQNSKVMLHQFRKLQLEDGLLVRKMKKRTQLVMPKQYHRLIFRELHDKLGHLGPEKVEELARQRFYWPYMQADIEHYIREQCACVASKRPNIPERAPLVPISATAPFELVCIDFLHLDKCQGHEYVLLITDHFSRFTQAYATKDKSAKSAARKLFHEFMPKFGFPLRLHHDRGKEWNNNLFTELNKLAGIKTSNTTPYHAMGNGEVERMNRTLINMLKALPEEHKKHWKDHLSSLTFAYNSTANKTTGYSPFFLVFHRESRLPIDCILPIEPNKSCKTYDQFVREWKSSIKQAFQLANQHIQQAGAANKRRYDAKCKAVSLTIGDRVLVRNVSERGGTGKLRSWWEQKIYEVVEMKESVPVYTVRTIDGKITKTVHRNMLMRVNDLPIDTFGQMSKAKNPTKKVVKRTPRKRLDKSPSSSTTVVNSDSDSSVAVIVQRTPAEKQKTQPKEVARDQAPQLNLSSDSESDLEVVTDEGVDAYDAEEESTDDEVPQVHSTMAESSSEDSNLLNGSATNNEHFTPQVLGNKGEPEVQLISDDIDDLGQLPGLYGTNNNILPSLESSSSEAENPSSQLMGVPNSNVGDCGSTDTHGSTGITQPLEASDHIMDEGTVVGPSCVSPQNLGGGDDDMISENQRNKWEREWKIANEGSASSLEETFVGFEEEEIDQTIAPSNEAEEGIQDLPSSPDPAVKTPDQSSGTQSDYVTPPEGSPTTERPPLRRSKRVPEKKKIFTYSRNFQPEIKRFDMFELRKLLSSSTGRPSLP